MMAFWADLLPEEQLATAKAAKSIKGKSLKIRFIGFSPFIWLMNNMLPDC
jgi:hypothetical protein